MVDYDATADRLSNELNDWFERHRGLKVRTPDEARLLLEEFNRSYLRFQAAVRDAKVALDGADTNFRIVRDRISQKYYQLLADRR